MYALVFIGAIVVVGFLFVVGCDGASQSAVDDPGANPLMASKFGPEFHGVWRETRSVKDIDGNIFDDSYFFIFTDDGKYYEFDDHGDDAAAYANRYQNCIKAMNKGAIRQTDMENVYRVTLDGGSFSVSYNIEMEFGRYAQLNERPPIYQNESQPLFAQI